MADLDPTGTDVTTGGMTFATHRWGPPVAGPDTPRPTLLLHGFPQSGRCWDRVATALAADGRSCVAPDQRGYSPGARPEDTAAYALPHLVADAVGFLDALGWGSADVVGHDWGAIVGWALAASHPERVRNLVAVSVPHPRAFGQALADDPDQQRRSAYMTLLRKEGRAEDLLLADAGSGPCSRGRGSPPPGWTPTRARWPTGPR